MFEYVSKVEEKLHNNKVVHYKNVFRVNRKNISEISSECLSGLSLLMNEYTQTLLYECFKDCKNIKCITFPHDFNSTTVRSMSCMFYGCNKLTRLEFPPCFDTCMLEI